MGRAAHGAGASTSADTRVLELPVIAQAIDFHNVYVVARELLTAVDDQTRH